MATELDHVIICVDDLETGSSLFESHYGLASTPGGRHLGHGTANHLVPLGRSYLELVAVVDHKEASGSPFGRWVGQRSLGDFGPDGVCLRTDDIEAVSRARGLEVISMSRTRPDGVGLHWRVAGLSEMVRLGLPFFIQWDIPEEHHPGHAAIPQAADTTSVELYLTGRSDQLSAWVGDVDGVSVSSGEPGIERVVIHTSSRTIAV